MLAQGAEGTAADTNKINDGGADGPSSTKAKLNEILESFQTFDTDMKIGTRNRREKDEHRISQLTNELSRLEKTLNQEIRRRVEMNKSVQTVRPRLRIDLSFLQPKAFSRETFWSPMLLESRGTYSTCPITARLVARAPAGTASRT